MYCKHCGAKMVHHLSFSKHKNVEYFKCTKCGYESKPMPYIFYDDKSKTIHVLKRRAK